MRRGGNNGKRRWATQPTSPKWLRRLNASPLRVTRWCGRGTIYGAQGNQRAQHGSALGQGSGQESLTMSAVPVQTPAEATQLQIRGEGDAWGERCPAPGGTMGRDMGRRSLLRRSRLRRPYKTTGGGRAFPARKRAGGSDLNLQFERKYEVRDGERLALGRIYLEVKEEIAGQDLVSERLLVGARI